MLFPIDECGPVRPAPIRPPSRAQRDVATLNAGIHPASGQPLRETRQGEVDRTCRSCRWAAREARPPGDQRPVVVTCTGPAGQADDPPRTRLGLPACDLWQLNPPPVHAGQGEIPGGGRP